MQTTSERGYQGFLFHMGLYFENLNRIKINALKPLIQGNPKIQVFRWPNNVSIIPHCMNHGCRSIEEISTVGKDVDTVVK